MDNVSTSSIFLTIYIHFKYGGLTHDVTGSFTFDVFKWISTSIILDGSCNIIVDLMYWEVIFLFFCKTSLLKLLHEFIVGSHPILMEKS